MSDISTQIAQLLQIISESKLFSELTEQTVLSDDSYYASINTGEQDAKKIKIPLLRGFNGDWNAITNTPTLANGTGLSASVYRVSASADRDLGNGVVSYLVDDLIYYNGAKWINLSQSTGGGGSGIAPEIIVALSDGKTLGKYSNGDTIPEFLTLQEQLADIAQEVLNPELTAVTFSLDVSGDSLRIVGSSTSTVLTFTFNRGLIKGDLVNNIWDVNATQNLRAGEPIENGYVLNGVTQSSNSLTVSNITVAQGFNVYGGTVQYGIGPQPLNSVGGNFDTPFPTGTSPLQQDSFEGVFPIFASTVNITTPTQQSLVSMINANNLIYTLVAEEGVNKQFFDIPTTWLTSRPLTTVQYFNTVSNQFDTANKISDFSIGSITKTIEGNTINYTRYTHNTSNRGSIKIRLIF